MIIFTYEDYLKNILKLDISSVFLKKVLSREDEEEEHTTEFTLCDVSEKYINIGRQEGMKKGRLEVGKQKIKEIVQKMLAENFTKEMIMKITGLKKEEIEEIK